MALNEQNSETIIATCNLSKLQSMYTRNVPTFCIESAGQTMARYIQ